MMKTVTGPLAFGVEEWQFDFNGPFPGEFAISYTVGGQTFWDNNFGHNYVSGPQDIVN